MRSKTEPVVKERSSPSRKAIIAPTSSGLQKCPIGILDRKAAFISGVTAAVSCVSWHVLFDLCIQFVSV
jgi:hypothetical protein